MCGRFVDLALAFASVDPIAAEETLRIIEEESARALAELRDEFVKSRPLRGAVSLAGDAARCLRRN